MNRLFFQKLTEALAEVDRPRAYVSPDDLFLSPNYADVVAFIFNPDNSIFYGQNQDSAHYDIGRAHLDYYTQTGMTPERRTQFNPHTVSDLLLLGRVGTTVDDGERLVSFWNDSEELIRTQLEPCLQRLEQDGHIDADTFLSLPGSGTIQRQGNRETTADQDTKQQIEMMRQLHLMGPEAKKAAMNQLGLATHSKKNPYQQALEREKIVYPSQKWWAMQSESV